MTSRRTETVHEFSIACGILDTAEDAMGPGKRLLRVGLTIGPLSGIAAESLEFCFSEIAQARGLGAPALDIAKPPVQAVCASCRAQYAPAHLEEGCPGCGSHARHIASGFECQIETVTFEEIDIHGLSEPE